MRGERGGDRGERRRRRSRERGVERLGEALERDAEAPLDGACERGKRARRLVDPQHEASRVRRQRLGPIRRRADRERDRDAALRERLGEERDARRIVGVHGVHEQALTGELADSREPPLELRRRGLRVCGRGPEPDLDAHRLPLADLAARGRLAPRVRDTGRPPRAHPDRRAR